MLNKSQENTGILLDYMTKATLNNVIGDLTTFDYSVNPGSMVKEVVEHFTLTPELPGVLIIDHEKCLGFISRAKCFEKLSTPYGRELFIKRPIVDFIRESNLAPLSLMSNTNINEAVLIALNRDAPQRYEPMIVVYPDQKVKLLDMHMLLLAQSQLLTTTNCIIQKQMEISNALSTTLNLEQILDLVLDQIRNILTYDQACIMLESQEGYIQIVQRGFKSEEATSLFQTVQNTGAFHHLIHSQKPIMLPYTHQPGAWKTILAQAKVSSWIGLPIIYSHQVIGLLFLTKKRRRHLSKTTALNMNMGVAKPISHPVIKSFTDTDLNLLSNISNIIASAIRNAQLHSQVQELASIDSLTSIHNRRGFFNIAEIILNKTSKNQNTLSVVMIDIDHFKKVNDVHGHLIGDRVIQNVAKVCKASLRDSDLIGRYGGEEFVVLLPNSDLQTSIMVAERLRSNVEKSEFRIDGQSIFVTISMGIAQLKPGEDSLDVLLQNADQALFIAKNSGRNKITIWNALENEVLPIKVPSSLEDQLAQNFSIEAERAYDDTIESWARALELRDKETEGHAQRVTSLVLKLAQAFGFKGEDLIQIRRGALLHDIGKIAIPDSILFKPDKLTPEEWTVMKKHPVYAYELLAPVAFLRATIDIPYNHHEHWDGSGYPRGLKGEEIPLPARLFAVVDVWDALSSNRCYRSAWEISEIYKYIEEQAGKQFDPQVVRVFLTIMQEEINFQNNNPTPFFDIRHKADPDQSQMNIATSLTPLPIFF